MLKVTEQIHVKKYKSIPYSRFPKVKGLTTTSPLGLGSKNNASKTKEMESGSTVQLCATDKTFLNIIVTLEKNSNSKWLMKKEESTNFIQI